MILSEHAREYYELQITTTATNGSPIPASGWSASFDGGTTWAAATVISHDSEDYSAWLVAGAQADDTGAVATIERQETVPLVRATDSPEIVVRAAPKIRLT